MSAAIPYTHWAYFEDPVKAQRCAEELASMDFLCCIDPSVATSRCRSSECNCRGEILDEWVLRAARDIPLDGWTERHDMVEAIVVRHGGVPDGGESGWLNLNAGDYVRQVAPDIGIEDIGIE